MKENKSKYAILGILSFGPMSGYDIKKMFEKSVAKFWNESYGQIYPLLKTLVDEGFAVKSMEKQTSKPDRHVYALTDKGRDALRGWLREPAKSQIGRIEILLKLSFGRQVSVPDNIRQVEHFRENQHRELQELKALEERVKVEKAGDSNLPYWLMTISYGKQVARTIARWCDETLSTLDRMAMKAKKQIREGKKRELSR